MGSNIAEPQGWLPGASLEEMTSVLAVVIGKGGSRQQRGTERSGEEINYQSHILGSLLAVCMMDCKWQEAGKLRVGHVVGVVAMAGA